LESWLFWILAAAFAAAAFAAGFWLARRSRRSKQGSGPSYWAELLDSLYNDGPIAFAVVDRQGRFLDINREDTAEIVGYSKEEMAGKPFFHLLDEESREATIQAFRRTLKGERANLDIRIRSKNGHLVDLNIATSPLVRRGKTIAIVVFFHDISERKRTLERNYYMAYFDDMTGLPNRRFFMNRLEEKINAAGSGGPRVPAVCHLDVDGFKLVNGSFGRDFGDMLLMQIAERLTRYFTELGDLARLEGDEFTGYLGEVEQPDEALEKVRALMSLMEEPFELDGLPIQMSVSIGVALWKPGDDAGTLLRKADTALHRAKANGQNDYMLHSEDMDPEAIQKLTFQHDLRRALSNSEFELYYQPQYDLASGQIVGMEALVRWNHPQRGFISPSEFISAAEESGLIVPLGDWVLEEACRQNKRWQDEGLPKIPVAVNLSIRQFFRRDLTAKVAEVLKKTGLEPKYLELEITESMTMDMERVSQYLNELTALGVQISIDDFGTGYSSLSYLKSLPIGRLKIDRSFVRHILQDTSDAAIVSAIIAMAHNLQLQVIAEGVETESQMHFLRSQQCDEMQGNFGSPPLPPQEAARLLKEKFNRFALPITVEAAAGSEDK
jgi:diguanylate cyclase (GGDEF)-like protein/PAS domain S-box-containing protein